MKTVIFYVKFVAVILLLAYIAKANALKPQPVPEHIQQEATQAVQIHKGTCLEKDKEELCIVGYDEAKDTFWFLIFNKEGVLYKVYTLKEKEVNIKWIHPRLTA